MDFFQWHWWAGVALVLLIAEIFVPGFFLLCLGIGCAGASIAAALGAGASIQLIAFSALSHEAFLRIWMRGYWKFLPITDALSLPVARRDLMTVL